MGGTLRDLVRRFHGTGRLGAIVLRPDRLKDAVSVQEARAEPGLGLIGDHRSLRLRQSDAQRHRELSLIQAEHLSLLGGLDGASPNCPGAFAAQPRDLGDQHRRDAFTFPGRALCLANWRFGPH